MTTQEELEEQAASTDYWVKDYFGVGGFWWAVAMYTDWDYAFNVMDVHMNAFAW